MEKVGGRIENPGSFRKNALKVRHFFEILRGDVLVRFDDLVDLFFELLDNIRFLKAIEKYSCEIIGCRIRGSDDEGFDLINKFLVIEAMFRSLLISFH